MSPPPAAQEARSKFEEAERSLKDMEESIRYQGPHPRQAATCQATTCHRVPWRRLSPAVAPAGRVPGGGAGDAATHPLPSPLHAASPSRSLEQEISFDFGPQGEFAYLYSQCYELTTNEWVGGAGCGAQGRGEESWARAGRGLGLGSPEGSPEEKGKELRPAPARPQVRLPALPLQTGLPEAQAGRLHHQPGVSARPPLPAGSPPQRAGPLSSCISTAPGGPGPGPSTTGSAP